MDSNSNKTNYSWKNDHSFMFVSDRPNHYFFFFFWYFRTVYFRCILSSIDSRCSQTDVRCLSNVHVRLLSHIDVRWLTNADIRSMSHVKVWLFSNFGSVWTYI